MVLEQYDYTKEGNHTPSSCALRCRGSWAGVMARVAIRTFISHGDDLVARTHSGTFGYTPYLVQWQLQESLVGTTGGECYGDKVTGRASDSAVYTRCPHSPSRKCSRDKLFPGVVPRSRGRGRGILGM